MANDNFKFKIAHMMDVKIKLLKGVFAKNERGYRRNAKILHEKMCEKMLKLQRKLVRGKTARRKSYYYWMVTI